MSANSARNLPECIVMKVGNWIISAILLGMLSATIWIAYDIWTTTADVSISENGYIALGVGAALSLLASFCREMRFSAEISGFLAIFPCDFA